jgi:hypothetical protein
MPRTGRKNLVGKKQENYEIYMRTQELASLERSLHRAWKWCGNRIVPIWDDPSFINSSNGHSNPEEAD